jgi:hypothetical protein
VIVVGAFVEGISVHRLKVFQGGLNNQILFSNLRIVRHNMSHRNQFTLCVLSSSVLLSVCVCVLTRVVCYIMCVLTCSICYTVSVC